MKETLEIESVTSSPNQQEPTARAEWMNLLAQIKRITPRMLVRTVLVVGLLALVGWLIGQAWVALLPFVVGGSIAYALLPLVNRLARFMPRIVAVLIALTPVVALGVLFVWLLVPISVRQFTLLTSNLPADQDIQVYIAQVRAYIETLPPNAQVAINNLAMQINTVLQARSTEISGQVVNVLFNSTLTIVSLLGFLLGFVIVPTWVLTVLSEQPNAARATRRLVPERMQGDVWAVLRILDRSFGWFLRGQVLLGIAAGVLVYAGLEILVRAVGHPGNVNYQLLLAMFAGLMQLIPFIGPIVGAIPAVLLGFSLSPELGIGAIVVFVVVQLILDNLLTPQLQGRIAGLNRNLLILIIVAVSQINFWLVLVAAPIAGIVYDLFRYAYGRFGDPPRPAGIVPGDTAWKTWNSNATMTPGARNARLLRSMNPVRTEKE